MEAKIFDRETMLDLVVNFIPLGIILFFIAMFVVVTPWGFELRTSGVMLGLMIVPFVALAVLTYISAKAIAGDERTKPLYAQGQAGLEEATPEYHDDADIPADDADGVDADGGDDDTNDTGGVNDDTVDTDGVDTGSVDVGDEDETVDESGSNNTETAD